MSTNLVLSAFSPRTRAMLQCTAVEVALGAVLQRSGQPQSEIYFPTTAVMSLVSTTADGGSVEIASIGNEGVAGLFDVLNDHRAYTDVVVQVPGQAMRADSSALVAAMTVDADARAVIDRFAAARLTQVARIAACNRVHVIGARLARWLLTLHDRAAVDTFRLPQQQIADMLGVHRPTIAAELQRLHAGGAIAYRGRRLSIVNRERLETLACECHASMHADLAELRGLLSAVPPGNGRGKSEILERLSHELRVSLQSILGWCELAGTATSPANAITVIERNARAQLALIEELLDG